MKDLCNHDQIAELYPNQDRDASNLQDKWIRLQTRSSRSALPTSYDNLKPASPVTGIPWHPQYIETWLYTKTEF